MKDFTEVTGALQSNGVARNTVLIKDNGFLVFITVKQNGDFEQVKSIFAKDKNVCVISAQSMKDTLSSTSGKAISNEVTQCQNV